MKAVILVSFILISLGAEAKNCRIRIVRDGLAARDILHQGAVMIPEKSKFEYIRNLNENLTLDECIKLAQEEGHRLTHHDSVKNAETKVTLSHDDLTEEPLELNFKQDK